MSFVMEKDEIKDGKFWNTIIISFFEKQAKKQKKEELMIKNLTRCFKLL